MNHHSTKRKRSKFGQKAGLAPGTVAYVGEARNFKVLADVIEYSVNDFRETNGLPIELLKGEDPKEFIRWINVLGIHDTIALEHLGKEFCLHNLVLEDIAHAEQRAKLDDYDNYLYLVVKMIGFSAQKQEIVTEQLSIILRGNTIISFIEDEGDLFDSIRERLRKGNLKLRKSGADYLVYSILDLMVDNYFLVLEKIGDQLETLESSLLNDARPVDVQELHRLKRELIFLRKFIWPMREVVGLLSKSDNLHIKGNTGLYLRDVYDHCVHAIDTVETFRDLTSGLMDVYLSTLSNKMNMVMKTLTVISTIFIPLTFIVGVYGMNFDFMPELHTQWGYPLVWFLMLAIVLVMLKYFKNKEWF
jgi:magnesium transporter